METLVFRATLIAASRHRLPLVVVFALLLSGCGTIKAYDGPELPQSEISVLDSRYSHGWTLGFYGILPIPLAIRHDTMVLEVDGHERRGSLPYHLFPGQHTAKVRYIGNAPVNLCGEFGCIFTQEANLTINFTTEAGHEYRIPAEQRDERYWIWVEDITTGKVVAGEKPPDDKGAERPPAEKLEPNLPVQKVI